MENKSVEERAMGSIPSQKEKPKGLHQRYHIEKLIPNPKAGQPLFTFPDTVQPDYIRKPVDENAEYFVMRLDSGGSDANHIEACRVAVNTYADNIEPYIPELAADLRKRYPMKARQDQGVVGTQGRESFIHKVLEEFPPMGSKYEAADFMRAHWPVSEGEGMNGWISADKLPDDSIAWCLVIVVEVNDLGISRYPWIAQHSKLHGWTNHDEPFNVTHWQPLPSPPQNQK